MMCPEAVRLRLADACGAGAAGATLGKTISRPGAHVKISSVADCLFCQIVSGVTPATRVLESDRTLAFRDINPQAPTHVLVITKEHHPDLAAVAQAGDGLLDELVSQAHQVAVAEGVAEPGYRIVFNTGPQAGQTVWHVHAHVLGGRPLGWPPG
jgi:histidine triad (HIT) family protein